MFLTPWWKNDGRHPQFPHDDPLMRDKSFRTPPVVFELEHSQHLFGRCKLLAGQSCSRSHAESWNNCIGQRILRSDQVSLVGKSEAQIASHSAPLPIHAQGLSYPSVGWPILGREGWEGKSNLGIYVHIRTHISEKGTFKKGIIRIGKLWEGSF